MKRILVAAAAAAMLASGPVLAKGKGNSEGGPAYDKGNQGCTLANGDEYKNPGKMLQALRARPEKGGNPKDIVDFFPNSFDSVGDLIAKKCKPSVD